MLSVARVSELEKPQPEAFGRGAVLSVVLPIGGPNSNVQDGRPFRLSRLNEKPQPEDQPGLSLGHDNASTALAAPLRCVACILERSDVLNTAESCRRGIGTCHSPMRVRSAAHHSSGLHSSVEQSIVFRRESSIARRRRSLPSASTCSTTRFTAKTSSATPMRWPAPMRVRQARTE
jgi:hypothetical protein